MISRCAAEVDAWREVKDGWRPLYGDVDQFGVAVEWHDFRTERSFDWGRSFHPRSLEFCLNLQGHGAVGAIGRRQSDYLPGDSGYYAVGDEPVAGVAPRARPSSIRYPGIFAKTFAKAARAKRIRSRAGDPACDFWRQK